MKIVSRPFCSNTIFSCLMANARHVCLPSPWSSGRPGSQTWYPAGVALFESQFQQLTSWLKWLFLSFFCIKIQQPRYIRSICFRVFEKVNDVTYVVNVTSSKNVEYLGCPYRQIVLWTGQKFFSIIIGQACFFHFYWNARWHVRKKEKKLQKRWQLSY